jgi:DNA-binding transcriptional MerR regulator
MKSKSNNRYTSKKVAEILGVYKRTLFNWETAGKIPKAQRDPMNNYRYWTEDDLRQLKKITHRG